MIDKLLKKQVDKSQLLFFALSSSLGLAILLIVIQLFIDTRSIFSSENDLLGNQNLIIYKDLGRDNAFTPKEIAELEQQPFINKTGGFTHGTYRVLASVTLPNYTGISTEMFLEAVGDEFLDIKSADWKWQPGDREVPIIIPKNYINLYNFGYAASTGMPQINEKIIRQIPIDLKLTGSSKTELYPAYILDASEKINSILVPESFLKYTNKTLSPLKESKISRIILDVINPSDPKLLEFLASKKYNYLSNDVQNSKLSYVLKLILSIVLGIGLLITILSIYLVITNINLLILKNKQTITQLHFLGYSKTQIAKVYHTIAYKILAISIIVALLLSTISEFLISPYLELLQVEKTMTSIIYLVAISIVLFILLALYYRQHTNSKIQQMLRPNTSLLTTEN
ncbi:FtsX-like permease family protein [Psychroserpens sp. NJDZ02]|uniref:FtsX-like permease family protein n=1 Tax=Psychroserpens sp. NJDZ02 TaxID=2570561 RepID=UPI0010A86FBD|nr:FtsX-like permease family protein [Psychroserpens sp. NJDZ02]QCE41857.1 FtsX-like permease family protein [Psychroserpens sp. NJDZ02]